MSKGNKLKGSTRRHIQDKLIIKQGNRCLLCQEEIALERLLLPKGWTIGGYKNNFLISPDGTKKLRRATIEHVIPKRDGGTNKEENLVLFCASCNHGSADERKIYPLSDQIRQKRTSGFCGQRPIYAKTHMGRM